MENYVTEMGSVGSRTRSRSVISQDFVPSSSGWTEAPGCYYLLVDIPDFKKEEIKVRTGDSDHVRISGKKQVSERKYIYFDQKFKVPENSDISKTSEDFQDGVLTITVSKQRTETPQHLKENEKIHETPNKANDKNVPGTPKIDETVPKKNQGRGDVLPCNRGMKESVQKITFADDIIKRWEQKESNILGRTLETLKENKGIVVAAVVAFSLGVLVSRKYI